MTFTHTRSQIRRILRKHRAISELAIELGVNRVTVSTVLRGTATSARILAAAQEKAIRILGRKANA